MKFTFAPESRPLDGYTIKRAIHRGGFGEVYYALSDAGKEVALKLLNNNLEVELRGVGQCLNLKHPNLVTIFDMREDADKDHWIVMEYVGGRGLYEVLQDFPNGMPLKDVLFWLNGIASGLAFLHDRGIVHRDLKPANVFCESGIVKIGDVGLSKYISESRRSAQTQSVGTVYYMAPEVARGRYGREVDVYAVGIMLVEMLTGRVPFEGETTAEVLMKHLTAEPDLSVLPGPLQPVLAACLEKDPARRIADIEELELRFREAVRGSGLSVDQPSPVRPSDRKVSEEQFQPVPPPLQTRTAFAGAARGPNSPRAHSPPAAPALAEQSRAPASPWQNLVRIWNEHIPTPAKWVIAGALILLVLRSGAHQTVAVGGLVGGAAYLAFRGIQKLTGTEQVAAPQPNDWIAGSPSPVVPPVSPSPAVAAVAPPVIKAQLAPRERPQAPQPRPAPPPASRVYTPSTARQIPAAQRATDLTTSLVLALFACVLVTAAVHLATNLLPAIPDIVLFGTVTLLASCTLIIPAKLWEGRPGDVVLRRLFQGSLGMAVGAGAWLLQNYLFLGHSEAFRGEFSQRNMRVGQIMISDSLGQPTIAAFMLFFCGLFLARRWWWQVDSFRPSRFRISSAIVSLLAGAILSLVLPIPGTLGITWALAISAVIQLSSGWTPQEERLLKPAPLSPQAPPMMAEVKHPVVAPRAEKEQVAVS
ncbi:MAG: protein kinase [Planctomycetaceae bacterium]|nr:protein kinase [Planctomycetaceae bacterium]